MAQSKRNLLADTSSQGAAIKSTDGRTKKNSAAINSSMPRQLRACQGNGCYSQCGAGTKK